MSIRERLAAALAAPSGVRELDLRGTPGDQLTELPESLGKLKELEVLRLDHNALTKLPTSIEKLKALRELHLAHNRLTNDGLPRGLWFLSRLEVLVLHGNPVTWVDNLGYQRSQAFELYLGGAPLDPATYLAPGGSPMHPMWHHTLHMLPLASYGKFRLRTVSLDLATLSFPLPGAQLHYEPPFDQVERLVLYGAPTEAQLAELGATFPRARIETYPDPSEGPHLTRAPTVALTPNGPAAEPRARPWHAEQTAALEAARAAGAKKKVELDLEALRPCVALTSRKAKKGELGLGATKLGGLPDLPKGTAWPSGESGKPMEFLGQVRLEDLAPYDAEGLLPTHGLLSFFAGDFEDGRVLYTDDTTGLERTAVPEDAEFCEIARGEPYPEAALTLEGDLSVDPEADDDVRELVWKRRPKKALHRALGHDFGDTYGTFEEDHVLLLAVGSDDRCDMEWGDVGNLYFAIRRDDLARRDWAAVEVFSTS